MVTMLSGTIRAGMYRCCRRGLPKTPAGEPLAVRIGIASGLVVVVRGASREKIAVGDTPSLAARVQALGEPGTIVIAATTRRVTLATGFPPRPRPAQSQGFCRPYRRMGG